MQYTDNYNLKKPDLTDRYSVGDFNDNADGIDAALKGLEDDKVNTSDVINNLTSTSTTSPLSAAQGKALNDAKLEKSSVVNNLTSDSTTDPLSAAQGKALNTNKIATSAMANNLTTTTEGYVLDARQGKVLKDSVDGKVATSAIANNLTTTLAGYVLDARQGKTLNDGKLSTTGDSANNTVAYTSADDASVFNSGNLGGQSAYAWTATAKIATGEKHSVLFNKISTMFKNIRTIAKLIGTTDISAVGDGTVSGAIGTLSSDLSELKIHGFGARVTLTINTDYICPSDGYLTVQCTSEVGACTTGWINGTDMIIVKSSNGDNYSSKSSTFVRKGSVIKFTKPGSVGTSYGYFWPLENQV